MWSGGDGHMLPGLSFYEELGSWGRSQNLWLDFFFQLGECRDWVVPDGRGWLRPGQRSWARRWMDRSWAGDVLFFLVLVVVLLEESRRRTSLLFQKRPVGFDERPIWQAFRDVFFPGISFRLLLFLLDCIRVAGVSRNVSKLSLVAIGVDVPIFAPDDAICSSSLLLEASISRFVAEGERAVVIKLVIVPDSLNWRSSGCYRLRLVSLLSVGSTVGVLS